MPGSAGNAGTTKDIEPFSTGRQLTWSFIKESLFGFDHELRSLESAHCGNSKPTFLSLSFLCRILKYVYLTIFLVANVYSLIKNNMSTSTVL